MSLIPWTGVETYPKIPELSLVVLDVILFEKYCSNLFAVIATGPRACRCLHEINAWLVARQRSHVSQSPGWMDGGVIQRIFYSVPGSRKGLVLHSDNVTETSASVLSYPALSTVLSLCSPIIIIERF